MKNTPIYYIGLMSGTSLDGIDAIVADFAGPRPRLVAQHAEPLPDTLRAECLALNCPGDNEIHRMALASNHFSEACAHAITAVLTKAGLRADEIQAIGQHGLTVRHQPSQGYTVQIGNHALLAELTQIAVVADFRTRDIAAGGQGAPLVPMFHQAMFAEAEKLVAVLNWGGIANLTVMQKGVVIAGFDCGPANVLLDFWCEQHTGQRFDAGGQWARSGQVLPALLSQLQAEPFFMQPAPKSTGRDLFNPAWLAQFEVERYRPQDVQATLAALTIWSSAEALIQAGGELESVWVCGGGAQNDYLMQQLQLALQGVFSDVQVSKTDVVGVLSEWLEAFAFAWLAWQFKQGKAANHPIITGAKAFRILGALYPA